MKRSLSVLSAIAFLPAVAGSQESRKGDLEFAPRRVVNAFPAIRDPKLVPAREAAFMKDDELVLGVRVGGEARAYPINMLTGPTREIVNDTLAGRPIAATW